MSLDEEAMKAALSAFGDNKTKFVELALRDSDDFLIEIERAINNNEPEAAGFSAHALRSIMEMVRATDVANIALVIEKKGEEGAIAGCALKLEQLQKSYCEVRKVLESAL